MDFLPVHIYTESLAGSQGYIVSLWRELKYRSVQLTNLSPGLVPVSCSGGSPYPDRTQRLGDRVSDDFAFLTAILCRLLT